MEEFHRIRPFKILAVLMVAIALVLTIVSLAGPEWVQVTFFRGQLKSWGLWWECWRVHTDFEMCVSADWLAACAAMMFLALIADVVAVVMGVWGVCAKRRMSYILAAILCIVSSLCQIICLIIYPVKFTSEVTNNEDYKAETTKIVYDWTFGIAWGAVAFLIGATVLFFVKVRDEEDAQPMKSAETTSPAFYSA